jgi:hypothetical protein
MAAVICALSAIPAPASAAASDPYCTGTYGGAPARSGAPLRFGIDPGIAGSAGGAQLPSVPDDPTRDLAAVQALDPPNRAMVVRLNRLFWSDGQAGIDAFQRQVALYTAAGFDVELQVRYHPPQGQAGNIPAWLSYVRHVVDSFGANRRVVSMTITNEANVTFSPNTSDGYYAGAEDALIQGIEAAHAEAQAKGYRQLRLGFTYAYRFSPQGDAAFFSYLGAHGGPAFQSALGFVGVDFYPGTIYPTVMTPGDTYRAELAQAAGVVRDCYGPMAGIGASVPIWFTENGVPTGALSEAQQAAALTELVQAACAYSGTYNISDYRWFNLRDSSSNPPQSLIGPSFSSFGLLRDDYTAKPSFSEYRSAVEACGASVSKSKSARRPSSRHSKHSRRRKHSRRKPSRRPVRRASPGFTG